MQEASSSAIGHQHSIKGALVGRLGHGDVRSSHGIILCVAAAWPGLVLRKNHQACARSRK
jgi:hypothetical protein